jgi:hypothetical protein
MERETERKALKGTGLRERQSKALSGTIRKEKDCLSAMRILKSKQ